ncbi:unnamed protein product [Urochloa humidicola]
MALLSCSNEDGRGSDQASPEQGKDGPQPQAEPQADALVLAPPPPAVQARGSPASATPPSQAAVIVSSSDLPKTKDRRVKLAPVTKNRLGKSATAATTKNRGRPPVSPTSPNPVARNIVQALGVKNMSLTSVSQSPLSQASQDQSDSVIRSPSPRLESDNESAPTDVDVIEVEDDDDDVNL